MQLTVVPLVNALREKIDALYVPGDFIPQLTVQEWIKTRSTSVYIQGVLVDCILEADTEPRDVEKVWRRYLDWVDRVRKPLLQESING